MHPNRLAAPEGLNKLYLFRSLGCQTGLRRPIVFKWEFFPLSNQTRQDVGLRLCPF